MKIFPFVTEASKDHFGVVFEKLSGAKRQTGVLKFEMSHDLLGLSNIDQMIDLSRDFNLTLSVNEIYYKVDESEEIRVLKLNDPTDLDYYKFTLIVPEVKSRLWLENKDVLLPGPDACDLTARLFAVANTETGEVSVLVKRHDPRLTMIGFTLDTELTFVFPSP